MQDILKFAGVDYKLKENYGPVDLDYGDYPMASVNDNGGCIGSGGAEGVGGYCAIAQPASAEQQARAACALRKSAERGGNNPFNFQKCPPTKVVGTGCMNPACKCPNCQGDCVCAHTGGGTVESFGLDFFAGRDLTWWIGVVLMAYLIYHLLSKGKKGGKK